MVFGESLATQTRIRTNIDKCPLPGSFVKFYVDWKFLIIALMVEMGIFLKATSLICKAQLYFFLNKYIYIYIYIYILNDLLLWPA